MTGCSGGIGNDQLEGGAGNDNYIIDSSNDFVVETAGNGTGDRIFTSISYAIGPGVDIEILSTDDEAGTASITLVGNELDNHLIGNDGANVLFGQTGDDILEGLLGNDQYIVNSASDRIVDAIGGGIDIVFATTSYQLESGQEIETLTPYDTGATDTLNLTGNEFAQIVFGNAGDNRLNGGGGADRLRGMNGNDTYIVDSIDDVVIELAVGGIDQVLSSVTYTLTVEVENLILTGSAAIDGTGNDSANIIRGNGAANVLRGGNNNDLIEGGAGADTLEGGDRRRHLLLPGSRPFRRLGGRHDQRLRDGDRQDRPSRGGRDRRQHFLQRRRQHRHRPDADRHDDDPGQWRDRRIGLPAFDRFEPGHVRPRQSAGHDRRRSARRRRRSRHDVGRPRQRHLHRRQCRRRRHRSGRRRHRYGAEQRDLCARRQRRESDPLGNQRDQRVRQRACQRPARQLAPPTSSTAAPAPTR